MHCVILHVSGMYNLSSLVPNLFPRANKKNLKIGFSVLLAMDSWVGPGNEATYSLCGTVFT